MQSLNHIKTRKVLTSNWLKTHRNSIFVLSNWHRRNWVCTSGCWSEKGYSKKNPEELLNVLAIWSIYFQEILKMYRINILEGSW